jgi:hypothetical protein
MLLVNEHGRLVDTPDDIGEELLQTNAKFRVASLDEQEVYARAVAKSHPRYLARLEARRLELEQLRNSELDKVIDAEIEAESRGQADTELEAFKSLTPNAKRAISDKPKEISQIDPDTLKLDDNDIAPQIDEAGQEVVAPKPRRRRRKA